MKGLIALVSLAVLGGCASMTNMMKTSEPENTWTRWVCDSQAEVLWRYADSTRQVVDVRLGGSDQAYHLKPEPGASGALYSDGVLAFDIKGEEGLVYWIATNDLIGRGCKAP